MENYKGVNKNKNDWRKEVLNDLLKNEAFCIGVNVGINLYQQKVIEAHKRKEHLKIGDTLYYLQDGRERLAEVLEKMCK